MELVLQKTGNDDREETKEMLKSQKQMVLKKFKDAQREMKKKKTDEEKERAEKAALIGECEMGYEVGR
jgi:hypothetical protein